KIGAWDQNLLTEWHVRYHGRGIMIYWHVEKKSMCVCSQVTSCSSSEVSAMLEGLLRHGTDKDIQQNFVDTHGQSEVPLLFAIGWVFNSCRVSKISAPKAFPLRNRGQPIYIRIWNLFWPVLSNGI